MLSRVWVANQSTRKTLSTGLVYTITCYSPPGIGLDFVREFSLISRKKGTAWCWLSTGLAYTKTMGHFRHAFRLCFKTRWSAKPFTCTLVSIQLQIKLIFISMVLQEASLSNRGLRQLGNGLLLTSVSVKSGRYLPPLQRIERFSNVCRKTKTKVISPANHNKHKLPNDPIRTWSKYM